MFGFSTIYVIFKEDVEFYWSRSRVLEKLNSLPAGMLPPERAAHAGAGRHRAGPGVLVHPGGPRPAGQSRAGGWDLQELRTIQDWHVRYALLAADGVSEVASIGGFVQEYQVDVDPDAMRALRGDARGGGECRPEVQPRCRGPDDRGQPGRVHVRGVGFIKSLGDLENASSASAENVPIYLRDVARVSLGPALRRAALDKGGAEAVGGVVVVRYGDKPAGGHQERQEKDRRDRPGLAVPHPGGRSGEQGDGGAVL